MSALVTCGTIASVSDFTFISPGAARHRDGWSVANIDRFTVEYRDSHGTATVQVDRGIESNDVFPRTLAWRIDGESQNLSRDEREVLIARIIDGMTFVSGKSVHVKATEWERSVLDPIEGLIARWEERGDSEALAVLLPAWRANIGLTDGWTDVRDTLRTAPNRVTLPADEAATLAAVADRIRVALEDRDWR